MATAAAEYSRERLVGDQAQRITVPLPRSIQDLRGTAGRHFRGAKGLYHHGRQEMTNQNHLAGLKHGDVIVVAMDEAPREAPPISTQNAHYIQYEMEVRPSAKPRQRVTEHIKFEGESRYTTDFVQHPMEAAKSAKPSGSSWDQGQRGRFTGKSTYNSHYPWHNPERQAPVVPHRQDISNSDAPFDGTTSYNRDFVEHPLQMRTSAAPKAREVNAGPFEGTTTYNMDYKRHPFADRTPRSYHRDAMHHEVAPFEGTTEYAREYMQHQMEARAMVHIEPVYRQRPRSARPDTPNASAARRPKSAPSHAAPRRVQRPGSGQHGSRTPTGGRYA